MRPAEFDRTVPAAVQRPVLQGHQEIAGLWFPAQVFDEQSRARRVLAQWRSGCVVRRFAQGDLLLFARPESGFCEALPGWPLTRQGPVLCSAPLGRAEAAALPAGDVCIVQGGQCLVLRWADGEVLDPSAWLADGQAALLDTYDCRVALPEPVMLVPAKGQDVRAVLGPGVPQASEDQRRFMQWMAGRRAATARHGATAERTGPAWRRGGSGRDEGPGGRRLGPRWLTWVVALVGLGILVHAIEAGAADLPMLLVALAIGGALWRFLGRRGGAAGSSARDAAGTRVKGKAGSPGKSSPAAASQALPARPSPLRPQAWRQWLARLAVTSRLSHLIGRQQAAYLRKMMALFDDGRLDDALRHAIPLGGQGESLGQAFGAPRPRADLSLGGAASARTSIHLGDDLDAYLRRVYRQAFDRLDREGRIDEAVFVLAELLQAWEEALSYLERHGRYRQAAELALGWNRPADVVVRLYCLAGDWPRAVAVARRDNAFGSAVLQLERRRPELAGKLRLEWAQALAAQGSLLQAVDALWPVEDSRAMAIEWLRAAQAAGGAMGARALVQRVALTDDTLDDETPCLQALRDDSARHHERAAMAQALLGLKERHARIVMLARAIAPGLLSDLEAGRSSLAKGDLQRLIGLADDAWLVADLPEDGWPRSPVRELLRSSEPLHSDAPEAGHLPVLDAAPLDDDMALVALGEAGAAVVDRDGAIVSRFNVPAHRIVIAHSRRVALAVARRDGVWRVTRLDLVRRSAHDLGMADIAHAATEFDGLAWTVAQGTRLRVLDTQHSLQDVLWQVTDLPAPVVALAACPTVEQIILAGERHPPERWHYRLPHRQLATRGEPLPPQGDAQPSVRLLHAQAGVVDAWLEPPDPATGPDGDACKLAWRCNGQSREVPLPPGWPREGTRLQAAAGGDWLMALLDDGTDGHCMLVGLSTGRLHADLAWPGGAPTVARIVDGVCLLADAHGRLWRLDTATSEVRRLSLRA